MMMMIRRSRRRRSRSAVRGNRDMKRTKMGVGRSSQLLSVGWQKKKPKKGNVLRRDFGFIFFQKRFQINDQ